MKHLKAHNFVEQGCFFVHCYLVIWRPIELKFSQAGYFMHLLRYTKCVHSYLEKLVRIDLGTIFWVRVDLGTS